MGDRPGIACARRYSSSAFTSRLNRLISASIESRRPLGTRFSTSSCVDPKSVMYQAVPSSLSPSEMLIVSARSIPPVRSRFRQTLLGSLLSKKQTCRLASSCSAALSKGGQFILRLLASAVWQRQGQLQNLTQSLRHNCAGAPTGARQNVRGALRAVPTLGRCGKEVVRFARPATMQRLPSAATGHGMCGPR